VLNLVGLDMTSGTSCYQICGFCKFSSFASTIPKLRNDINPLLPNSLSVSVLKNLDEQTVIALYCAKKATSGIKLLNKWGAIVAPKHPGRKRISHAFEKFWEESAWVISPHLVPYDSLHSPSGIISIAYQLKEINLGVGGQATMEGHCFLSALTILENNDIDGLVLIWTGYKEEFPLDHLQSGDKEIIEGYALAITKQKENFLEDPSLNMFWHKEIKKGTFITPVRLDTLMKIPDNFKTDFTFQVTANVFATFSPAKNKGL